ncbi:MAG: methyltransferase domain-containing protein [Polyangiaceae bacterium]|nr:methyltransferase domain-containing protein [Polyangiaceae bacterium]MCB9608026.1 methyltransferase domain-containing protein [Polyangiaceae bacterium]
MTDEERQQAAAAAAKESDGAALEDEAPPEIPDLDEEEISDVVVETRLSSKPPPKPRRVSSDGIAAVRGSIPPPPPSARRLAAADPVVPPTPKIDVLLESGSAMVSQPPAADATVTHDSSPPEPASVNPRGTEAIPGRPASVPPRSGSVPPPHPASVPPRAASVPPPRPASVPPPRPASVPPPRPASVPPPSAGSVPPPRPASFPPPAPLAPLNIDVSLDDGEDALDTVVQNEVPTTEPRAAEELSGPDSNISVGEGTLEEDEESAALQEGQTDAKTSEPPSAADSPPQTSLESADQTASQGSDPPPSDEPQLEASAALKGVTIPDDEVPSSQPKMEVAPSQPSALLAMRIISIKEPERPPTAEDEDAEESLDDLDAEEIADEELAPESTPDADGKAKPPPPPKKRPPPPRAAVDKERAVKEAQAKRKVRPWWEELFGDDFGRAIFTPKPKQIAAEVDFIEQSLGVARGGVVLDLACGSGEHAVELASRGYAVVGYDLSITMLAQAQEIAQERGQKLNFLQGDMREMAFEDTFDGVYCWSSAFGYFEEEKNINVAQRIFRALRPGGTFLLEMVNRDYVAVQTPSSVWFEGDGCVCMDDAQVDWITSRLKVKRTVMLDDGRSKECNYSLRLYALHELGKLLHDVGFVIRNASGQIATPGVFFGPNSPSIIVLAQKPKGE